MRIASRLLDSLLELTCFRNFETMGQPEEFIVAPKFLQFFTFTVQDFLWPFNKECT